MNSNNVNTKPDVTNTINDPRFIFGNFGGFVSQPYVKYCNLIALEFICIFIFSIFYFFLLTTYDEYLLKYEHFSKKSYFYITLWRAILLSVNFQATANYTPIQFKHIYGQTIITIQLIISLSLAFLFLTV
jgi:hypothetical protein